MRSKPLHGAEGNPPRTKPLCGVQGGGVGHPVGPALPAHTSAPSRVRTRLPWVMSREHWGIESLSEDSRKEKKHTYQVPREDTNKSSFGGHSMPPFYSQGD